MIVITQPTSLFATRLTLAFMFFLPGQVQLRPTASEIVHRVLTGALARCYSSEQGVRKISWVNLTPDDLSAITSLGNEAVDPLRATLDMKEKDGFTQLMAVKLLIAIGSQASAKALVRAVAPDEWEVTRAQALAGLFMLDRASAKPYIVKCIQDPSMLVRERAQQLTAEYP